MKSITHLIQIGLVVALLSTACAPYFRQPLSTAPARLGAETPQYQHLTSLPSPQQPVTAAVYKFRDQTGQYKDASNGISYSTAITQGTTSILLRALEESGWFVPIEREGLSNLLNERKIIRSSRDNFSQKNGSQEPDLSPLLFAGILLEGGIVSYDANVLTGGAGLRYFGAGASGQYRQDRVTVYLRATSTQTGRILKTVYTSKTVLSQKVDVGLFRFVSFQRLLETETGFTYNEPGELAVREAIEKAVEGLVIEGVLDGLWNLQYEEERNHPAIQRYLAEKEENQSVDALGGQQQERRGAVSLGLGGGVLRYGGDFRRPTIKPAVEGGIQWQASTAFALNLSGGRGTLATEEAYQSDFYYGEISTQFWVLPRYRYSPFLRMGLGLTSEDTGNLSDVLSNYHPHAVYELGFEYLLNDQVGIQIAFNNRYLFSDELDQVVQGRRNDFYWGANLGVQLYLGR
ncbi:CsgG/HfaB family protein [Tunicatimonas pelagia]|uniref:CsgG/HfaB family protein n=1 Tax=Tunicatimonas pelagia TaxID=931531 RepID=UPI00266715C1|nr:CsgG/HfaB family protein [Tunicatimonas pelagia]WKN43198.1 CsgG/HfaB family protein [Tunicatimonas pelagia]